jgi:hypothetical protein
MLAWFTIIPSAAGVLVTAVQSVAALLLPVAELVEELSHQASASDIPPSLLFVLEHFVAVSLLAFAASLATLVVAIGLLLRRKWGWFGFLGVLAANLVGNLWGGWLALQLTAPPSPTQPQSGPWSTSPMAQDVLDVATLVLTVVSVALCVWIGWRLCSPPIRAEFGRGLSKRSE